MDKKYDPTKGDVVTIKRVYDEFSYMRNLRNSRQRYFNDRTLKAFIDDSQLRVAGFVPSRESQGKESWQANVMHPVTRNKMKAMLASVALDIPQIRIVAENEKNDRDRNRAEMMKNLVKYSYDQDNKEEQIFFEAWEAAEKGTVIVYDGYLKTRATRKIIQSYDPETGDIETKEEEVEVDNQCVNFLIPLLNLYIKDFTVFNIQNQPSLCWVERMDKEKFDLEYGRFKNSQFVPLNPQITDKNETDSFFREYWSDRVNSEEPIEVVKYFNKWKDEYIILANGVVLNDTPMLLGKKKKWYPFAKTVFEPFATDFFYGNSLPNTLMGEQDVINSLFNMALDKTYKSMAPALLIGNVNKDDFDLEDQNTTIDTKIYVQDITQVREMPIKGIGDSDIKMIDIIGRGLDLSSVDANQQGVAGRGVTAREVVIANENAKKLKGVIYMFLTSLWVQKVRLRIMNILVYYTQPKLMKYKDEQGNENIIDSYQTFLVENADLSPIPLFNQGALMGTRERKGTLGIKMVGSGEELPSQNELDIEEETGKLRGGSDFELVVMNNDYLDDWTYDIKVVSESVYQNEASLTQTKMEEKMRVMGTYFPEILQANKEKLFRDTMVAYEDDPDDYEMMPMMPQQSGMPGQPTEPGAETATAGQAGLAQVKMPSLPPLNK